VGLALAVALCATTNAHAGNASATEASVVGAQDSTPSLEPWQEVFVGGTIASDATGWAEARDIQPLPALAADAPELEFVKAPGP
jgi:hypothetical protein